MQITEVEIRVVEAARTGGRRDMLRAYCSITIDDVFVVHDLKVIDGANGLFVAMPQRPLKDRCGDCRGKNPRSQAYCGHCGVRLGPWPADPGDGPWPKLHADVVHPIRPQARLAILGAILSAYAAENQRRYEPGEDRPWVAYDGDGNKRQVPAMTRS